MVTAVRKLTTTTAMPSASARRSRMARITPPPTISATHEPREKLSHRASMTMKTIAPAAQRRRGDESLVAASSRNGTAAIRNAPNTFGSPKIEASRYTSPKRPATGERPNRVGESSACASAMTAATAMTATMAPIAPSASRSEKPTSRGR